MSVSLIDLTGNSKNFDDKEDLSSHLFNKWRLCELVSALFAAIGLALASIDYEFTYSSERNHSNCAIDEKEIETYKLALVISTLLSINFLFIRDREKSHWIAYLNNQKSRYNPYESVLQRKAEKRKTWNMIRLFEILLLFMIPYPYMNVNVYIPFRNNYETIYICYTLNEIMYSIMFTRLYLLYRAIINYTPYENHLARNFCTQNNTKANVRFSFRCLVNQHSIIVILFLLFWPSIIFLGVITRIYERPVADIAPFQIDKFQNPLSAMWIMYHTMSGMGQGIYPPFTYIGRLFAVLGYFLGTILTAFIILFLQKQTEFTTKQTSAFRSIYKTKSAALCVQAAFSYFLTINEKGRYNDESLQKFEVLRNRILEFKERKLKLSEMNTERDISILDLKANVNKLESQMCKMEVLFEKIANYAIENLSE
ncbi:unnamed protein product [Blepharisma stoltei]|uniref:Potassium channel domain-containing protein n=1 Tax=Blepharisma stoltei TaxID=1481888 RepID=A0AAU9IMA4_9CILI|nr:unnamed protein product [Blepharisma stoltei]